jgi:ribose transport system substrate-binding protein
VSIISAMRLTSLTFSTLLACALATLATFSSCKPAASAPDKPPRVAFITNGVASFWTIAKAGAEAAALGVGVDLSVHMPAEGIADQKRSIEDLLIRGVDGIALSPIDSANQASFINEAAAQTKLITQDSDAPTTNRLAYVGMDNYLAGRMVGQMIKEALPNGGKLAIVVGRIEQDNARKRRQGVIDEVIGRSSDSSRYDPPGTELTNGNYTFVVTLTDQFDRVKAKANCEDAVLRYTDLNGIVGLFAYNIPMCLEALKQTGHLGKLKLFSFDEADETLHAIQSGSVYGTVVQNPYEYGFRSIALLKEIVGGNLTAIPESKFIDIPARRVDKGNVDEFWADLKKKLGA